MGEKGGNKYEELNEQNFSFINDRVYPSQKHLRENEENEKYAVKKMNK